MTLLIKRKQNRGTSLLELLIYIAILSGLMVVVTDAFNSLSKGRGQSQARSEVNAAVRFATEKIRQDIKSSTVVMAPVFGTSSSTLSMTASSTAIVYDVSEGRLRRKLGEDAPVPVTGLNILVSTPTFTRIENYSSALGATTTAVQLFMTMSYNTSGSDWTYSDSLRTTITLR